MLGEGVLDKQGMAPVVDGLFAMGDDGLALLGSRCTACGTYYFPKLETFCRNPDCASEGFESVRLSRTGKTGLKSARTGRRAGKSLKSIYLFAANHMNTEAYGSDVR